MMKIKLLTIVSIVLVAVGVVMATDVINVDIKGYNDYEPYVGNGAYDVGNNAEWVAFYGGWGVPVGSARSEALVGALVPPAQQYLSSVYAAQVWIGDNGLKHGYQYGSSSSLMNDGFVANVSAEPNISIWGLGAYQDVYNIYVYGNDAGTFKLTQYGVTTTKTVTGGVAAGQFVQGGNYVIFTNVDVNSSNPQDLYLTYTNKLNALQFVRQKSPFVVEPNSLGLIRIEAGRWDVAGDRNTRDTETTPFGPDTFTDANFGREVGYIDSGEFMYYDINVDDANHGQYGISLSINTMNGVLISMNLYLDDKLLGDVNNLTKGTFVETDRVTANLFKGIHTISWEFTPNAGDSTGFSIIYLNFYKTGPIAINNCNAVGFYGLNYPADLTGDCTVGLDDLASAAHNWLICNNPDPNGCF
jgi:hypothetical protein